MLYFGQSTEEKKHSEGIKHLPARALDSHVGSIGVITKLSTTSFRDQDALGGEECKIPHDATASCMNMFLFNLKWCVEWGYFRVQPTCGEKCASALDSRIPIDWVDWLLRTNQTTRKAPAGEINHATDLQWGSPLRLLVTGATNSVDLKRHILAPRIESGMLSVYGRSQGCCILGKATLVLFVHVCRNKLEDQISTIVKNRYNSGLRNKWGTSKDHI